MFLMSMVASPIFWVLTVIWYILVVAGAWKMFEKAGEAGWKAIIPIYNMYIVYKLCWNTSLFWIWFGISVFAGIFGFQTETTTGFAYIISMILSLVQMLIQITSLLPAVIRLRPQHPVWSGTVFLPLHFHGDPRIRQFHISALADKFPGILIIFGKLSSKIPILMEPHELPD